MQKDIKDIDIGPDLHLSGLLASLFPPGVVIEIVDTETGEGLVLPEDEGLLLPEEERFVSKASELRRKDFMAGRVCARRGLAKFGLGNFPILIGKDRAPVWPSGIIGSISHAEGCCGVVLAKKGRIVSLGLDIEGVKRRLSPGCRRLILTENELSGLNSIPLEDLNTRVILFFSAKECFYKCQYPITRQWLNFHDVTISLDNDRKEFWARLNKDCGKFFQKGKEFKGRYLFHRRYVFTGLAMEDITWPFL